MSLNLRLGLEESELGGDSRIIVTESDGRKLGLIVDTVYSVSRYSGDEVEKPESVNDEGQFITGIVHHEDGMILLLNLHGIMD
jgi:purine-binding chemotaxis protein CheW